MKLSLGGVSVANVLFPYFINKVFENQWPPITGKYVICSFDTQIFHHQKSRTAHKHLCLEHWDGESIYTHSASILTKKIFHTEISQMHCIFHFRHRKLNFFELSKRLSTVFHAILNQIRNYVEQYRSYSLILTLYFKFEWQNKFFSF